MAVENPTELELVILKVLWDQSPLTARQIREVLAERGRELAHTSVITMLQRMVDKGQVDQLAPDRHQNRLASDFERRVAEEDQRFLFNNLGFEHW